MFIRNESFYSFTRRYPVVTVLIAIHLVLYLLASLGQMGIFPFGNMLISMLIGQNFAVALGEWWRLITPIFLHIGLTHMLFNSFALFLFGPALESMMGRMKFISFYLLTGVLANIATFFLNPLDYTHLGASGAIYGLFGLYVYMMLNRKELIDPGSRQIILIILVIGLLMTFLRPNINIVAHIFGALAGFIAAPLFLKNVTRFFAPPPSAPRKQKDIVFDPNRWKKKRRFPRMNGSLIANIIGITFILLILIGVISRFIL